MYICDIILCNNIKIYLATLIGAKKFQVGATFIVNLFLDETDLKNKKKRNYAPMTTFVHH